MRMLASSFLPFGLSHVDGESELVEARTRSERLELRFTLGAKQLSHATLLNLVDTLRGSCDPLILIAITGQSADGRRVPVAYVPTRASLIRASLDADGGRSIVDAAGAPEALLRLAERRMRRAGLLNAYFLARWWAMPFAFAALCWATLLRPAHPWLGREAGLFFRPRGGAAQPSRLAAVLPPVPNSLRAAFELGGIAAAYSPDLARAAELVGRRATQPLTAAELAGVHGRLEEIEAHTGLVARVTGAFSFVNLVWLLAILGITVSIGPSIIHVLAPIRDLLKRWARWLLRRVIEPVATRLHQHGVFELAAWAAAAAVLLDAHRLFPRDTGTFVAATAIALAVGPCFGYSTLLWGARLQKRHDHALLRAASSWAAVAIAPVAAAYSSRLLAYMCTLAAYTALGFGASCRGLCWCVGFDSQQAMERVAATSTLLLGCFFALRESAPLAGVPGRFVETFVAPVSVVGSLTLYLALLVTSSLYYRRSVEPRKRYGAFNLVALCALLAGAAVGATSRMPGLYNTAATFLLLWIGEKYCELHLEAKWNGWLLVLVASVALYRAALAMHDHPEWLAAMFGATSGDTSA